ncbi:hypothetical protein DFH08DRAFT_925596 [Mycena albidolilacea]|uniref:R3H domain-containing protein n=1 Tax=Mycena albidolilacea TaxID=1033008 RepID=A0AAD7ELP2_9AGAR|nr:hypothetical protein DFH08DRAFT_925596 [Mycena albidolilacea]
MEEPDNPARPAERPAPEGGRGRNHNRRNNQRTQQDANVGPPHPRGDRGRRPPRNGRPHHSDANPDAQSQRPPRNGRPQGSDVNQDSSSQNWRAQPEAAPPRRGRAAKFNAGLTDTAQEASSAPKPIRSRPKPAPVADDLTSRLTAALSTPPYPDCPICFSAVHPAQPTWSCSPSISVLDTQQYCWTTFHLKCIRSWAAKSVKELADAWAARGEPHKGGEWRCPGCQARRVPVPTAYRCFCNAVPSPAPPRISTPHSCASPCARVRPACAHPCPLLCHPGPCPPCRITTDVKCGCPKGAVLALRCGETELSCGAVCGRTLACGAHACTRPCHADACDPCAVRETARCWCGKHEKEVGCGEGEAVPCSSFSPDADESWIGRFACADSCDRLFACGVHRCAQPCHPASGAPAPCPRSPENVRTCPCGRRPITIAGASAPQDAAGNAFPPRADCSARIPTCGARCGTVLPCGHACAAACHEGGCPPCTERVVRPCRCGGSTRAVVCAAASAEKGEVLCEKTCKALRACGRHQCLRVCCPLASVAALQLKNKGKKRNNNAGAGEEEGIGEERGGLHECDLVCGKVLGCGEHRCEERDHKGPCGGCLRSGFEEVVCPCGLTVLEPPIPCGTRIHCTYPCPRPPPACGHPRTPHTCHDDDVGCPPCPFLAVKRCMCGKKEVGNVRCAQERVGCGAVCGKLMACGWHRCERVCHPADAEGGCGPCAAVCGKSRKACLPLSHPCTQPCHAPAGCDESAPCSAVVTVSCACGRIRQPVSCGRAAGSAGNGNGNQKQQPKCTNECLVAKRNARLADALGITQESREQREREAVVWPDDALAFGRANAKFVAVVEKAFAEFVAGEKKMQVLPHMPAERRKFVHDVAAVYRMDTQMVDQEPHRSVQLLRRFDTKVPAPLLSAALAASAPPSLGKLGDLRAGATGAGWRVAAPTAVTPASAKPAVGATGRAWGAAGAAATPSPRPVVAPPAPSPAPAPARAQPTPTATPPPVRAPATAAATSTAAVAPATVTVTATAAPLPGTPQTPVPEDWEDDA